MNYHKDKGVNSALIRLFDELCEFERNSGRRSTLILIPERPDELIIMAQDGKPLLNNQKPRDILNYALRDREELG